MIYKINLEYKSDVFGVHIIMEETFDKHAEMEKRKMEILNKYAELLDKNNYTNGDIKDRQLNSMIQQKIRTLNVSNQCNLKTQRCKFKLIINEGSEIIDKYDEHICYKCDCPSACDSYINGRLVNICDHCYNHKRHR
jgi:hypothetical protein